MLYQNFYTDSDQHNATEQFSWNMEAMPVPFANK